MTKKSSARLAKDAQKKRIENELKDNRCFDDINELKEKCTGLLLAHGALAEQVKDIELLSYAKDRQSLNDNLSMLSRDLLTMSAELNQISVQHSGKSGGSSDPDELYRTIAIAEQYGLFMERHEANIMPTVTHLIEQINQAENRRNGAFAIIAEQDVAKAAAENGITDPSVISDVEFKEVQTERTLINVQLDANDPNPAATIEAVAHQYATPVQA